MPAYIHLNVDQRICRQTVQNLRQPSLLFSFFDKEPSLLIYQNIYIDKYFCNYLLGYYFVYVIAKWYPSLSLFSSHCIFLKYLESI